MILFLLLFLIPMCKAMEADPSMYQQGKPGDYGLPAYNYTHPENPMKAMYPQDFAVQNPLKESPKPLKRTYEYSSRDPFALLFALAPHFERNGQALSSIQRVIWYLHQLDISADQRGADHITFTDQDPLFELRVLGHMGHRDPTTMELLYRIAYGINRIQATEESLDAYQEIGRMCRAARRGRTPQLPRRSRPATRRIGGYTYEELPKK